MPAPGEGEDEREHASEGGGQGGGGGEVAEFAALLRALKERTDRSYGSLARRLGMNTSTLHRYCAGEAVPLDFAPVERFAALCGASPEQRLELHRHWLAAAAARRPSRTAGTAGSASDADATPAASGAEAGPDPEGGAGPDPEGGAGPDPEGGAGPVAETGPAPRAVVRRPWYRRRRRMTGLACVCAVLVTLGALSALPGGQRTSAGGPQSASAEESGEARVGTPPRRDPSPSGPGGSPGPARPSGSVRPSGGSVGPKPGPSRPPRTTSATPRNERPAAPPLTWSANSHAWDQGCGHDYVVARPPGQVPPPPVPQDAAPWAATQNAAHGGRTLVQLTVQGSSDTAVVLEALRVRVVGRTAPAEGNAYAMDQGCGGSLTPRYFAVDLDKDRPITRAVAGNDSGTPIPAVRLPYRVSAKDPEVLLVTAETGSCDCQWYLELDWSSQGREGTVRIDDQGRPFRTTSIAGLPRYAYDTQQRRWQPYS
ncbi:helix-turn-helix domain-containing protein [Streptomyces sp. NPDC015131]|uniref:transcriptional regulator n=1 Tax=Streptomyces sp. NPDC015131 TaxID=3364941 RepID=UPI0036F925FE